MPEWRAKALHFTFSSTVRSARLGNTETMSEQHTDQLLIDLAAEVAALDVLLSAIDSDAWSRTTPAPGWNVADQVVHLGLFDRRALWSMADEERFTADLRSMAAAGGVDGIHDIERVQTPEQLLQWWRTGTAELAQAANSLDMSARCVWYGPPMSAKSMLTARLMETWAHGHDIADALGVPVQATQRLRHVAHIGVRAMGFAFVANKQELPEGDVFVALTAPNGEEWTWGNPDAVSSVRGDALGFCQAVTQRRHIDDCGLHMVGELATTWMSIAQAFAGAPGVGRTKGQFD